jgi:hypothetical protein
MQRRKRARSQSKPRKDLPAVYVSHPPSPELVAFMAGHGVAVLEIKGNARR